MGRRLLLAVLAMAGIGLFFGISMTYTDGTFVCTECASIERRSKALFFGRSISSSSRERPSRAYQELWAGVPHQHRWRPLAGGRAAFLRTELGTWDGPFVPNPIAGLWEEDASFRTFSREAIASGKLSKEILRNAVAAPWPREFPGRERLETSLSNFCAGHTCPRSVSVVLEARATGSGTSSMGVDRSAKPKSNGATATTSP